MQVDIQNFQHIFRIDKKKIVRFAEAILKAMGEHRAELSLVFVNDLYIKGLNYKYRNIDSSTDVLAFPLGRDEAGLVPTNLSYGNSIINKRAEQALELHIPGAVARKLALPNLLGDVVISIQTAKREAKKRKVFVQKEIELYLTHGILHLLGYNDENKKDRKKMRAKEKELLERY